MQKLSEIKKMWVWNICEDNPKISQRYPLYETESGIVCVSGASENDYLTGEPSIEINVWQRWGPIKEPEKRYMTRKECIEWAIENQGEWAVCVGGSGWRHSTGFRYINHDIETYRRTPISNLDDNFELKPGVEPEPFMVEVEE